MPPFTKPLICPSRRNSAGGLGLDSGYALLFVMLAATLILVSLTAVLPSVYQEGQREREQELIFRGTQYARAIANFHQKFQRFPTSVNELTKLTNGYRFLRKEFADPMTPSGKWRFIHANSQGVLLDSKTQGPASGGQGQPGAGQGTGGFGMSGPSSMGGSAFGQQSSAFSGAGNQGGGTYIVGVASTSLKKSIRIWNQKTHYDEWEFIGVDLGALGLATSITGLPQGTGGQSGQGDQPNSFGQPSQGNPTTPGQNQGFSP